MSRQLTKTPIVKVYLPKNSKVAAVTMVYDSPRILEKWVAHYGQQFGYENLYILSHGVNEKHREVSKRCNFVVVPREVTEEFDWQKSSALSGMVNTLLNFYTSVVCGDSDELIIIDPALGIDLESYICSLEQDTITAPVGLNLLPSKDYFVGTQPFFDLKKSALSQCEQVELAPKISKPSIMRGPVRFAPGQHSVFNNEFSIDYNLYICHLKFMAVELTEKYEYLAREMDDVAEEHGMDRFVPAWRKGLAHLTGRAVDTKSDSVADVLHPGEVAKQYFKLYRRPPSHRFLRVKELAERVSFKLPSDWLEIV